MNLKMYTRAFLGITAILLLGGHLTACLTTDNKTTSVAPIELKLGEGWQGQLGYYETAPRFSWKIPEQSAALFQTAYQIQVSNSPTDWLTTAKMWDSGKVQSDLNSWVRYQGEPLQSRTRAYWRVRIWDEDDRVSDWSETQELELGLLQNSDWQAKWIGHVDTALDNKPSQSLLATPQYLRTTFEVKQNIKKARLYVTAKGLFKAYLNGQVVAPKDVMTPGWTPYDKRIETLTYDVTEMVETGENVLGGIISGGWYAGRIAHFKEQDHQVPARWLAQLEITYASGEVTTVVTDENWQATINGPIRFASIYDGEHYDQNKEMQAWSTVNFDASNWQAVVAQPISQQVALRPKQHAPVRIVDSLAVADIVSVAGNKVVFDFGQNMVGVPRLNVPAIANEKLTVRFAEALHKGAFYTENYRTAESTNHFIPAVDGKVDYTPTFTYHGYRYVEISGFDPKETPNKDWVTALIQHSDIDVKADFKSSHAKLNKLAENVIWGMRSNFYDIPLDCPQRDERLGWTGDAQVFATPSMYMADVYSFWAAWLKSVREEQTDTGKIPNYIPYVKWLDFPSSGWGDAATIIPWDLYMATGDKQILIDNYEMMNRWVEFHGIQSEDYISKMMTFGDWLQPYPVITKKGDKGNRGNTDFSLIGTAYYARSVELTLKSAKVLGKQLDVERLATLHGKLKDAFYNHFFDEELNLKQGLATQTTYLLGLAYDLFPEDKRHLAEHHLLALLEQADNHLRTGFLGTPLLAEVLQEAGHSNLVYELIFKETYPSWFYSINNGATTTWERWNSYSLQDGFNPEGMNSLNHYAYGSISRWFYEGILGIKPLTPGFKHFKVEPQFGKQLNSAEGSYDTPQGKIEVSWQINGKQLSMFVEVPKNTQGDVLLPQVTLGTLTLNSSQIDHTALIGLTPGQYQIKGLIK